VVLLVRDRVAPVFWWGTSSQDVPTRRALVVDPAPLCRERNRPRSTACQGCSRFFRSMLRGSLVAAFVSGPGALLIQTRHLAALEVCFHTIFPTSTVSW